VAGMGKTRNGSIISVGKPLAKQTLGETRKGGRKIDLSKISFVYGIIEQIAHVSI
jgi:uncharacterized membrane protein YjjP (DUF1212 family)